MSRTTHIIVCLLVVLYMLLGMSPSTAESVTDTSTSVTEASTSVTGASTSVTDASTSVTLASTSVTGASISVTDASTSATGASISVTDASTSATGASISVTDASTSATGASTSVTDASTSVTDASTSVTGASTSVTDASTSVTDASTQVTDASTSVTDASTSVTDATTSVTGASASVTDGSTSMTDASTSVTGASTSVTDASASVTDGSTSMTDASTAMTDASTSVTDGSTSVTDGLTSVTDGSTSVTDGLTSVTDASTSVTDASTPVTDASTSTTDKSASTIGNSSSTTVLSSTTTKESSSISEISTSTSGLSTTSSGEHTTATTLLPVTTEPLVSSVNISSILMYITANLTVSGEGLTYNSSTDRKLVQDFVTEMSRLLEHSTVFRGIRVTRLGDSEWYTYRRRRSSPMNIVFHFSMVYLGGSNLSLINESLPTSDNLTLLHTVATVRDWGSLRVAIEQAENKLNEDVCSIYTSVEKCRKESYNCTLSMGMVTCRHACLHHDRCGDNGECYFDDLQKKTMCRCKNDENGRFYTGSDCSVAAYKLALPLSAVIGISAGLGGALLLVILVLVVRMIRNRKKASSKEESSYKLSGFARESESQWELKHYDDLWQHRQLGTDANIFDERPYTATQDNLGNPMYMYRPEDKMNSRIRSSDLDPLCPVSIYPTQS